jgi:hypothetical protein
MKNKGKKKGRKEISMLARNERRRREERNGEKECKLVNEERNCEINI